MNGSSFPKVKLAENVTGGDAMKIMAEEVEFSEDGAERDYDGPRSCLDLQKGFQTSS